MDEIDCDKLNKPKFEEEINEEEENIDKSKKYTFGKAKNLIFKDDKGNVLTGTSNVDFDKMKKDLATIKICIVIFIIVIIFVILYSLYRIESGNIISNIVDKCLC